MKKFLLVAPLVLVPLGAVPEAKERPGPSSPTCKTAPALTPADLEAEVGWDQVSELLGSVRTAADNLRDYTAVLVKQERFNGSILPRVTMLAKWARPYKIYFRNIRSPDEGREILFVQGNGGELTAHKGSFPDITVSLDIRGSTAMDGNHHPIDRASLLDLIQLFEENVRRAAERQEGVVRLHEDVELWGRRCIKLVMHNVKGGRFHTLRDGETLWDVAERYNTAMHHILHHNPERGWREPDDPCQGDRVFVPRYYGGRFEVWIDRELNLPIQARVFDHYGQFYEQYEHRELRVNVGLTERDFDADNPDYDF